MPHSASRFNVKATLALTISICCWATIPVFLRSFIDEIDAWTANGIRYPMAAILWVIPFIYLYQRGEIKKRYFILAIPPTLVNLGAQTLWAAAVYYMEPGVLVFLHRISLAFAIIGSFYFFPDERALLRSGLFWLGITLSVIGFIGMNLFNPTLLLEGEWRGLLIIFVCAIFFGFYGVSVRYFMGGVKPWVTFPIICLYTALVLLINMFLFGEWTDVLKMETHRLGILALSALMGIGIAHVCFYYAIQHIGVSVSSGCQLSAPFLTVILSFLIFGELFTAGQWIAGIGILSGAGCLLLAQQHLGQKREPVPIGHMADIDKDTSSKNKR